jgi:probable F420-dependent oxidoreductase
VTSLAGRFGVPVGVRVPYRGPRITPERIVEVARAADEAGFDAGWIGDHLIWPRVDPSQLSPSEASGPYPYAIEGTQLEALSLLSFIAARTRTIELATGILVATYRSPVLLAKQVATLDFLSGGRVLLGVAAGWMRQEFDALGVPFSERGRRLDETIRVLRCCWSQDQPEFHGRFWDFGPVHFEPQPSRPIPIWVGGHGAAAWRRAAMLGDGWIQSSSGPQDLEPVKEALRRWRPEGMGAVPICAQHVVTDGNEGRIGDAIARLREAGASSVLLKPGFEDETPERLLRLIDAVVG